MVRGLTGPPMIFLLSELSQPSNHQDRKRMRDLTDSVTVQDQHVCTYVRTMSRINYVSGQKKNVQ